jgi:hypothetical protein
MKWKSETRSTARRPETVDPRICTTNDQPTTQ